MDTSSPPFKPSVGSVQGLDRHSSLRRKRSWLEEKLADQSARVAVLVDMKPVVHSTPDRSATHVRWFSVSELADAGLKPHIASDISSQPGRGEVSFLGSDDAVHYFSFAVDRASAGNLPVLDDAGDAAVDLRSLAMQGALDTRTLSLLGEARALTAWHRSHRCCGRCGSRNRVRDGGWRLECRSCGQVVFPRTDPVVIMLITDGERCLLGREHRYDAMFYSCLAGFLEPGEDVEDAVRREVFEETAVRVGAVHYHSSQPWPFPHTLMIGCIGHAETTDIVIDPEIQDARWVTRQTVRAALAGKHTEGMTVPGPHAIAHHLLQWFTEGGTLDQW